MDNLDNIGNNQAEIIVTVTLKARLQPFDRGDLEDVFLEICEEQNIQADVVGGGTLMDDNGEAVECDIEIAVPQINEEIIEFIIGFFEATLAPKGSILMVDNHANPANEESSGAEYQKIPFGRHEGVGLYLNGVDLPDKVYEECDINHVYDECNRLLEGVGRIHSHWQGAEETALYMYGDDYDEMVKRIEPFVTTYPLCEKSRVVRIA